MTQSKRHNNYKGIHLFMMTAMACGTCYCDGVGDVPVLVNGVNGIVISPATMSY